MAGGSGRPWASDEAWLLVEQASDAGAARRAATDLGERLGLDAHRCAELALVATELATNLVKHARQGTLLVRSLRAADGAGVGLVAVDSGPGVADLAAAAVDGTSSTGTLGLGLGAILRLSTACAVHGVRGRGTVVAVEVWAQPRPAGAAAPAGGGWVDGLTRPMTGEEVCGDAVAVRHLADGELLLGVDGLGHGPQAARAAAEAVRAFHDTADEDPVAVLAQLHAALRGTRGAAVAVALVQRSHQRVRFAGLGNVSGWVVAPAGSDGDHRLGGRRRSMLSQPGIVGHHSRSLRETLHELPDDAAVVLHSDGVRPQWSLDDTPGVLRRGPLVLAATLLRDAGVRRDDASVLVDAPSGGEAA